VTVIVSSYEPGARPLVDTDTVVVAGPKPEEGPTASQEAVFAVVQPSVPEPLFEIPSVWVAGSGPPTDALNVSSDGLTTRVGDAAELA